MLLLVGLAAVLGAAFLAGMTVGRQWPDVLPLFGGAVRHGADAGSREARARPAAERPKPAERAPVLTFYQELTAPLPSPPPKPKPERVAAAKPGGGATQVSAPAGPTTTAGHYEPIITDTGPSASSGTAAEKPYTVQVGAFAARGQADALAATLTAAGFDAYVAEMDSVSGLRYRVRVGAFPTRDAALPTVHRLAERRFATYVTVR
jgi:cell division protein FtsN